MSGAFDSKSPSNLNDLDETLCIALHACGANGWNWLSSRTVASFAPGCNMTKPLTATPEALLLCENMVLYPSVPHYPMVLLRFPVQICHFGVIPSSRFFWTTQMSPTFGTQPDGSASASFSAFCSASQPGSRSCVLSRGCAKMDSQRYLKFAGFLAKIQVRVDSIFQQNTHNTYLINWDEDFIS